MTILFPKRKQIPQEPHVFVVDAHPSILKYIPENLKPYIEFISHEIKVDPTGEKVHTAIRNEVVTKQIYDRYRDEATLVITSRLHCAAPCIAMEIPVIVIKNGFDDRFGWIDKFIHLYTPDEFDTIDWNPAPIDIEQFKERVYHMAISMIERKADKDELKLIHTEYMSRDRKKFSPPFRVRAHTWLSQYFPALASFLREKVLRRFTIISKG